MNIITPHPALAKLKKKFKQMSPSWNDTTGKYFFYEDTNLKN